MNRQLCFLVKEVDTYWRMVLWGDKDDKTWETIWRTFKFNNPIKSFINQREGVWWKDTTGISKSMGRDVQST